MHRPWLCDGYNTTRGQTSTIPSSFPRLQRHAWRFNARMTELLNKIFQIRSVSPVTSNIENAPGTTTYHPLGVRHIRHHFSRVTSTKTQYNKGGSKHEWDRSNYHLPWRGLFPNSLTCCRRLITARTPLETMFIPMASPAKQLKRRYTLRPATVEVTL